MRRVEIVNLGGRAHHVESDGVAAIDAWLDTARLRLNGDPDRDDLLLDFERAIGEKCDARVAPGSDVVTNEDISSILESLGTIEPSDDGIAGDTSTPPHVEEHARRLYRLPNERMIAGVCSGLAAWMRVDVTVVRVGWAVLTVLLATGTDGAAIPFSIALYALMAFVLPRADSPETRAAAHGHGVTAQDRLLRARSGALPALTVVGSRLSTGIRVAARVARVLLLIVITAVLAVWVVGAIWLAVAGDPVLQVFGDDVSSWLVPHFLTCVAVILVTPPAALAAVPSITPSARNPVVPISAVISPSGCSRQPRPGSPPSPSRLWWRHRSPECVMYGQTVTAGSSSTTGPTASSLAAARRTVSPATRSSETAPSTAGQPRCYRVCRSLQQGHRHHDLASLRPE